MAFRSKSGLAAALFMLSLPLAIYAQSAEQIPAVQLQPHDFKAAGMSCLNCHQSIGVREPGRLVKPVGRICADCHSLLGPSHPVDIVPSFQLPSGFPLDEQKRMTCSTCHDIHRGYIDPATGSKTMYLRRSEKKKDFCLLCHKI